MKKNAVMWIFVLVIFAGLNLGAIRKKEDPIVDTQTNPISYKQKQEETKDGEKGAPSPSFKFYKKATFLSESPVEPESKEEATVPQETIPSEAEPVREDAIQDVSQTAETPETISDEEKSSEDEWDEISDEPSEKTDQK